VGRRLRPTRVVSRGAAREVWVAAVVTAPSLLPLRCCRSLAWATRRRPGFGRLLDVRSSAVYEGGRRAGHHGIVRMLELPVAWVRDVAFGAEGVIVTGAARAKKRCARAVARVGFRPRSTA
jgi:hypothetical protein